MSAFPPHHSLPSTPVSASNALERLSTYLALTTTSPHLLPNATLQATGPIAPSSSSNLTIHNLKRVEAGLRGEWLAPTLDIDEETAVEVAGADADVKTGDEMGTEGWVDLEEYQREQSIEDGEVGPRATAVIDEMDVDVDVGDAITEKQVAAKAGASNKGPIDKEARKADKRARKKEEQRQKAALGRQS